MPDQELGYVRYFAELPDPRSSRIKHSLHDILGVTLCAVLCGADTFEEIERFGEARLDVLRQFLPLPGFAGIKWNCAELLGGSVEWWWELASLSPCF